MVAVVAVGCLLGSISYNSSRRQETVVVTEKSCCCSIVDVSECRGTHCWLHPLPEKVSLDVLLSELATLERYLDEFKQCICEPGPATLAAWNYTHFFLNRATYVAEELLNK